MNLKLLIKFIIAIALAATIAITIHIHLMHFIDPIIANTMATGHYHLINEPYPPFVVTWAYMTSLLPATGCAIIYYLIGDQLPGRSRIVKGILFGLLLLLAEGNLIRQPLMGAVVGNPFWLPFFQQSHMYAARIAMGIILALIIPPRKAA